MAWHPDVATIILCPDLRCLWSWWWRRRSRPLRRGWSRLFVLHICHVISSCLLDKVLVLRVHKVILGLGSCVVLKVHKVILGLGSCADILAIASTLDDHILVSDDISAILRHRLLCTAASPFAS